MEQDLKTNMLLILQMKWETFLKEKLELFMIGFKKIIGFQNWLVSSKSETIIWYLEEDFLIWLSWDATELAQSYQ